MRFTTKPPRFSSRARLRVIRNSQWLDNIARGDFQRLEFSGYLGSAAAGMRLWRRCQARAAANRETAAQMA